MNKNIDLTKILKDCPEGTTFWSDNYGEVQFKCIVKSYNYHINYPILVKRTDGHNAYYTKEGWHNINFPSNCLLWPSKNCRDWSKFTASWSKKEKFDPRTLNTFDKILVRDSCIENWYAAFFSHIAYDLSEYDLDDCKEKLDFIICTTGSADFSYCIPFNDETKHLVGTKAEAPEFYRYWED